MIRAAVQVSRVFRERLLAGFSWNVISSIALQGSVLLSTIIVARLLGVQAFGAYSVLVTTVMMIANIGQGGIGLVAAKFVAESLPTDPSRVGRLLAMCRVVTLSTGVAAALFVFVAADVIGTSILRKPEIAPQVRLIALAILFQVLVLYQYGALQGFGAFRELGRAGAIVGVGHVAFTAVGAMYGDVSGATVGFVLASAFRMAVFRLILQRVCRDHGVNDKASFAREDLRLVWQFGLPAGLAGFVTLPSLWLVTVLVARFPDGLAMVAMFSVAHQIRLAVVQLPSLLNAVSFSVLSRLKGGNAGADYRNVFWSGVGINMGFSILVVGMLVLVAEPVLGLYGREFVGGRWVLVLMLVSVIPEMLATTFCQLIQSAGRMWHSLFLIAAPRDFGYLALTALFLPIHGIAGAALAYLVAQSIGLVSTFALSRRFAPAVVWKRGTTP